MNQQYLDVARQASDAEKRNDWAQASDLWSTAIELATGKNSLWATARYEFCCKQNAVHSTPSLLKIRNRSCVQHIGDSQ